MRLFAPFELTGRLHSLEVQRFRFVLRPVIILVQVIRSPLGNCTRVKPVLLHIDKAQSPQQLFEVKAIVHPLVRLAPATSVTEEEVFNPPSEWRLV